MANKEITITRAAELSGMTRQHIHDEIQAGRLAARQLEPGKPRSPWLIDSASFVAWCKKRGLTVKV